MFHYIDRPSDLEYLSKELCLHSNIGIDTEFRRKGKYDIQLSLMQVSDSEEIYLIDCIAIEESKSLCSFLGSKNVEKVFHSCKEDIEALLSWTDIRLVNFFDTQLANAFLGETFSISYQDLVKQILGVSIDKNETRSNWIRRPLSNSQLAYAASDVQFLLELYSYQMNIFQDSYKLKWFKEELEFITSKIYLTQDLKVNNESREESNSVSKSKENILFNKFNLLVEDISQREKINSTLFFSKKSQKEFISLILKGGLNSALLEITDWRKSLLQKHLFEIFKNI